MASSYTSLLGLVLPVQGELQGTWGDTVNNELTSLLDTAIAGTTTISTDADVTLTDTDGSANQARQAIILWTANGSTTRNITAPAQSKSYVVINKSAGTQSIVIRGAGPTTGVTILKGEQAVVAWDGSDFVKVSTFGGSPTFTNVTVTGTTTLSGLTASTALALNASKEVVSVTNTGTGNNVLSASPTLTGTVDAAAATLSGNLTLSAGTANGVAYLNGSKVVTTGSALTFDGTNFGIGTSSPKEKLDSRGAAVFSGDNATGTNAYGTAAGLLLSTSSDNTKARITAVSNGANSISLVLRPLSSGNAVDAVTIDSSGNLGLGVTPSAWSGFRAFDIANVGALATFPSFGVALLRNTYYDGSVYRYKITSAASYYDQDSNGFHIWYTAPSGTAGAAISFTQAMTLDASGNLGIGTSSPAAKLHTLSAIGGNQATFQCSAGSSYVKVQAANSAAADAAIHFNDNAYDAYIGMMNGTSGGVRGALHSYTGGAIRTTLDSSGNLGIGTSSPGAKLEVQGTANVIELKQNATGSATYYVMDNTVETGGKRWRFGYTGGGGIPTFSLFNQTDNVTSWVADSSGNLGIGVSSPSTKLDVSGQVTTRGSIAAFIAEPRDGSGAAWSIYNPTGDDLRVFGNSDDRMVLNNSGNMGLGVTPSAWGVSAKALQISSTVIYNNGSADSFYGANYYFDGSNNIYITSAHAAAYGQVDGAHQWFTAPSGTAGAAISFTQAMTLDASGNLMLGGTSTTQLDGVFGQIIGGSSKTSAGIALETSAGAYMMYTDSTDALIFWDSASNAERARITSGGDLLVGATSNIDIAGVTASNALVSGTNGRWALGVRNTTSGTPWGVAIQYSGAAPNDTSSNFLYCYDSAPTLRMSVRSNGGIANYSANDVNLSDRREKTNFAPAKSYLDIICAIPVQTFNYIDQSEDDPGLTLGVVAQDVQAVAPELVHESNWGTEDNPKMRLSVYQTDLQYALMKCVQELKTELDSVKAELATMKGQS